ncbi:Crp/Fnr family transcriptional regulator [Geosporobacter ferrireducens]|uniref:Crp/Fnr family transcriptional regulator n=1 Tax=Geosporobacter ferrireducens TaxID=1424294 RepID=A0A1D8GDR2_9FIRM|nr:Crp/Fnr family transcriptional regulator [Geosporobacter ferrireducens]AOT69036.1 Crp/Fnr family transcriptional regulator [Geosporobacter ferrireducens]MTI56703.1 Crp/Fnr family transcriptional regulator [Geosporobacter ferrireducens]
MKACCERCETKLCASKVSIFAALNNEELFEIVKMTGHRNYHKGETIFLEDTEAKTLYLVNEGKIKIYKYTKDGKEQILHILSEGDFFGELNLFKTGKYSFNAEAIAPTKLCTLTKEKMRELILAKPEIGLKILEVVGERLAKVETLVQNLATNDVEARIAYLLLDLKERYGRKLSDGTEIKLPLTREEMSNYTGIARETMSRKLKKFEEEGILKLVGIKKIIITDEEKLEDYL